MPLVVTGVAPYEQEELDLESFIIYLRWFGIYVIPIYWRTGNSSKDLLDIGLEPESGRVVKIKLVIVEAVYDLEPDYRNLRNRDMPQRQGIPVCDMTWWHSLKSPHYLSEFEPLTLRLGNDTAVIKLGNYVIVESCIVADRVTFGLDGWGVLRVIEIQDLSSEEMGLIKRIFHKDRYKRRDKGLKSRFFASLARFLRSITQ